MLGGLNHCVQRTALVSTNSLQLLGWQPITAILAASSEDSLLIGQFLAYPAMSQPIRRDQVSELSGINAASILYILLAMRLEIHCCF